MALDKLLDARQSANASHMLAQQPILLELLHQARYHQQFHGVVEGDAENVRQSEPSAYVEANPSGFGHIGTEDGLQQAGDAGDSVVQLGQETALLIGIPLSHVLQAWHVKL